MTKNTDARLIEKDMRQQLTEKKIDFSPFELSSVQWNLYDLRQHRIDALIDLNWAGNTLLFIVEQKSRSDSLQTIRMAIEQVLHQTHGTGRYPMVYLPYLSKKAVRMLEEAKVSGFDLCGNLFICIPGKIFVERTGKPNRFPSSAPIKNIYQKNSSLVPRLFLMRPIFESIQAIVRELKRRNGSLTQATVSKVCKRLEEDIIIGKRNVHQQKQTYLIQPEVLMENLAEKYIPPNSGKTVKVKLRISQESFIKRLLAWKHNTKEDIVQTGVVSCTAYTVMARAETPTFYCSHVAGLLSEMSDILVETERFADFELIDTADQFVYFDQRELRSSPIQSYLELMRGDKRDRQAAEMIGNELLKQARLALEKMEID